jgi:hypothetical protein
MKKETNCKRCGGLAIWGTNAEGKWRLYEVEKIASKLGGARASTRLHDCMASRVEVARREELDSLAAEYEARKSETTPEDVVVFIERQQEIISRYDRTRPSFRFSIEKGRAL